MPRAANGYQAVSGIQQAAQRAQAGVPQAGTPVERANATQGIEQAASRAVRDVPVPQAASPERTRLLTGVPRFLDKYMLAGVTGGNQYKQLDKVMGAIEKYGPDTGDSEFSFYWRRAHMAAGRHDKIRDLPLGAGTTAYPYRSFGEATSLFHEARALLDAGEFATLAERTDPYLVDFIEATIGEYADAAVLRAIATKLSGAKDSPFPTAVLQRMAEAERLLDYQVLQNLAGTRIGALPAASAKAFWHGKFWSERVPAFGGEGRASDAEIAARDPYMRGVLAWLAGDNEVARSELKKCIEADQRCSHEYHVAQWLLAHPLAEKQKEEPK